MKQYDYKIVIMIVLYGPEKPDAMIDCQYGYKRYDDWIALEAQRIGGQPGRKVEIIRKPKSIALRVNCIRLAREKIN